MDNIVECIGRRYRVQTTGGTIIEVESDKPLSIQLNAKLLEEDSEINEFFKHHKVLSTRQLVRTNVIQQKTTDLGSPKIVANEGYLNPRQRINALLKMKGEFTRQDYITFLFDNYRYKLSKWTSFDDITDALKLNRIEVVKERKGKEGRKYRIIDSTDVEESLYDKLLQDRKLSINTLA